MRPNACHDNKPSVPIQLNGHDDDDLEFEEEGEISDDPKTMAMTTATLNESLSDSINLFQAIHVLQGEDDERAFKTNNATSGTLKIPWTPY